MGFIDCDSHVIETGDTWARLGADDSRFFPQRLVFEEDGVDRRGVRTTAEMMRQGRPPLTSGLWVTGDTWSRVMPENGAITPEANTFDDGILDLTNPGGRVEALDALGIDVQVIFSTFFLGVALDNPLEEVALASSYNRWMAEGLDGFTDRLKWLVRPPLRSLDQACKELEFGKAHGAVGVQLRGIEHGYYLCDPYFFPLYEKAQELDLAILIHNGVATRSQQGIPIGNLMPHPPALMEHLMTLMAGFHAVISTDLWQRFPTLRWGFVEGGASWAPAVIQQQARRDMSLGLTKFLDVRRMTAEDLERRNVYVAVETDEDIPYLTTVLGPKTMCFGTDFGHNDTGSELGGHRTILERSDIDRDVARRIVDENARTLFGIDPAFRPAPAVDAAPDIPHIKAVAGGPAIIFPPQPEQNDLVVAGSRA